jgi:patatin-like phospholipase/acyl hydrolase
VRVLSIDGGGIRGLIPATVLATIEERAQRPVSELFDLLAGTSTGGILACALTAPGADAAGPRWRAEELVDLYRSEGPKIFSRSLGRRVRSVEGLLDEKYDDEALVQALSRYLGDTPLGQARKPVLLTAYDLHGRETFFFKSWRPEFSAVPMAVAAQATSVAPTYFEPLRLGDTTLVDGGVFAGNPAMCAYAEAARLAPGEEATVVSLGCGRLTRPIEHADAKGWGLVEWVRPLIDVVFDGVSAAVSYQLDQLIGDRHHRFQVTLDRASDDLDDASARNLELLAEQASALIAERTDDLDRVVEALTA